MQINRILMSFLRRRPKLSILIAVITTTVLTVLVLNLSTSEKKIDERITPIYSVRDSQFLRSMGSLLGPALLTGNAVVGLRNGNEVFPAMLGAIRSARQTITFETYIYWSGAVGDAFADALLDRAKAGVKVHVLVDWVGSNKMEDALLERMEQAGIAIQRFHPPRWYTLSRMNNRTHRKLLVVDGRIGFTGGIGIADHWLGNAQDKEHWRDSHYMVTGPVVAEMQAAFLDNWMQSTGELLHGDTYFPRIEDTGAEMAQVFRSDPGEGSESARLMYLLSMASARQDILLAASYFLPDDLAIATLVAARKRGVNVEVIVPGPIMDTQTTRRASRARWGDLLRAGVAIYEYQPTMYHCKIMVVDGIWTSVGSTNIDDRSLRLNDEANLNVYDSTFAASQIADFRADRARARRITLEEWEHRPWREKLAERATTLLRSQL